MEFYRRIVEGKSDNTLWEVLGVEEDQLAGLFWMTFEPETMDNFQKSLARGRCEFEIISTGTFMQSVRLVWDARGMMKQFCTLSYSGRTLLTRVTLSNSYCHVQDGSDYRPSPLEISPNFLLLTEKGGRFFSVLELWQKRLWVDSIERAEYRYLPL